MQEFPKGNQDGNEGHSLVYLAQIALRACALGTCIGASCLTFTCKQTALVFGVPMDAKYSYTFAFKFFAFSTAIVSAFAFLSLFLTFILYWKGGLEGNLHFLFFLHDLVMTIVLVGSSGAATAIGYVGVYGNDHAGWVPICDNFHAFCHRLTIAIVLGYIGFFSFLALAIISATKSSHRITTAAAQVQDI